MNKPLVLNPKDPMPFKLFDESDVLHWICGECSQIHVKEDEAYECCKMVPWPLDYNIDDTQPMY